MSAYVVRADHLYWSGTNWLRCQFCAKRYTREEAHREMHPLRRDDPTKNSARVVKLVAAASVEQR